MKCPSSFLNLESAKLFRWEVGCEVIWWNLVEEVVNELGSGKLDSGEYLNLNEFLE